jgi:hypothetical protein
MIRNSKQNAAPLGGAIFVSNRLRRPADRKIDEQLSDKLLRG